MAAGILVQDVIGSQRSLIDLLTMVEGPDKPMLAMMRKGPLVNNMLYEWPTDKHLDAVDSAVPDGMDVTTFGNADKDYAVLSNRLQWIRPDGAAIGKLAALIQNQAGVKNKKALAIKKKLEQLWRSIECALCSDQDVATGTGTVGSKMRGMGAWISASLSITGMEGTITPYIPTSGAVLSGAIATGLTEPLVQTFLQTLWTNRGKIKTWPCVCGATVKRTFTDFTNTQKGTGNVLASIRTYDQPGRQIVNSIDSFTGDFGTLELMVSQWLAYATSGSSYTNATYGPLRAYIPDMDFWELVWMQGPKVTEFEDKGGGERFAVDAIVGNRCFMPLYNGKFAFTS